MLFCIQNEHIWGVSFLKFCDLMLILGFWILKVVLESVGIFWVGLFSDIL